MNRLSASLFFLVVWACISFAQTYSIKGTVRDAANGDVLPAATVSLLPAGKNIQTSANGSFKFSQLQPNEYRVLVKYIGFEDFSTSFLLSKDTLLEIIMQPKTFKLNELVVKALTHDRSTILETMPVEKINRVYLLRNNSTNFAKTLASLPGVASMDIGAGFSKPVIRGMAFNRIAVVDKGIVQQNQQWGADHGLEIDQYDVDNVRVHKGPLSLFYGSDAMGGVIEILPVSVLQKNMTWGDATLIGKSNNNLIGASVMTSIKHNNWFVRARITGQEYADYRIPADTITYLTWKMPVYDGRLKNTAGKEYSGALSVNFDNNRIDSWLHVSDVYGKNGFFPGSHGIPVLSRLEPDGSTRNVDMPYAFSNHIKVINNTSFRLKNAQLMFDAGYQQNLRKEMSLFHTHYSNQQPPQVNPNEELSFLLNTYSFNVRTVWDEGKKWSKTIGVSSEYQQNSVGGYSFLLPEFERIAGGIYFLNKFALNNRFSLAGGVRYDVGNIHVSGSYDTVLEEYLTTQNYSVEDVNSYAQRAAELQKTFNDFSGSIGFSYKPNHIHSLKMNVGKSFRYPSANELAANGVHHGAFRHEKGDSSLVSEKGYQLDVEYEFVRPTFSFKLNPFVSYFSNYIYLNPTGEWSVLPHTGQIYRYTQSNAFLVGGEASLEYLFAKGWSFASDVEYMYNINLSDGYPLPFSPPAVFSNALSYSGNANKLLQQYTFTIVNQHVFAQNRIARNELKTPSTNLTHLSAHMQWQVNNFRFFTDFQVQNLFDTPFLNHLSFYRKLNAPEQGRNIQLILKIPFENK